MVDDSGLQTSAYSLDTIISIFFLQSPLISEFNNLFTMIRSDVAILHKHFIADYNI